MARTARLSSALSLFLLAACGGEIAVDLEGGRGAPTWEEFRAETFREPDTGIFIVNGDTPILNEKKLREFYDALMLEHSRAAAEQPLIVHREGGADVVWNDVDKLNLTYCVSTGFGGNYNAVVQAMSQATAAWEAVANVDFIHASQHDSNCTASTGVVFDVRPVNVYGQYIARAFFPYDPRYARNVLIDGSAFYGGEPSLLGVLRHELGHTLGFRHEHTRPEAGACYEDNSWRPLTPYDSESVMHYPQCNGTGDWSLTLTALDAQGAASLYGAPGGGGGGEEPPPPPDGEPVTETVNGSVAQGQSVHHGPYAVVPGTTFQVTMSGSGDPDLYVRFGVAPTTSAFDCRPYLAGASESCSLTVPAGVTEAYVMVRGYSAGNYALTIDYTAPEGGGGGGGEEPPPSSGEEVTQSVSDSVSRNQSKTYGPLEVVSGTRFLATMSGTGDPDLYVRFGAPPSTSAYDCRPYLSGANETCDLTVPAGADTAYIMVRGYRAATYNVSVTYTTP